MLIKKASANPEGANSIETLKALFNLDSEDLTGTDKRGEDENVGKYIKLIK